MNETIHAQKDHMRQRMLTLRNAITVEDRAMKSLQIQERLLALPQIATARHVNIFVSFRSEVHTHDIIRNLLAGGKIVSVPVVDEATREIVPSYITSFDDLRPGGLGILEPPPDTIRPVDPADIDLVVTPGAAFCAQGWRLGYGGGFYDRILKKVRAESIALAFDMQVIDAVPHNPASDMPVGSIVTESRVVVCMPTV